MKETGYDLVVPIVKKDLESFNMALKYWMKYLPIKRIVLVGKKDIEREVNKYGTENIIFFDEEQLLPYNEVCRAIEMVSDNEKCKRRTGWYLQQFLKMKYATICQDEYYLIWDSDTIPLKPIIMFDGEVPFFDVKMEFQKAYFDTISKLFDGCNKIIEKSFISEHMIIKCEIMCELIDNIEKNTSLTGNTWVEKIINSIDVEVLSESGFSEFETYGTYVVNNYSECYHIREWKSCRNANMYFNTEKFNEKDAKWLSKEFDAASFEKSQPKKWYCSLFHSPLIHMLFPYSRLEMIFQKLYFI